MNRQCFQFEIFPHEVAHRVRLTGPGIEAVEHEFCFDWSADSQVNEKLGNIDENICGFDDIRYVGQQLWLGLAAKAGGAAIRKARSQHSRDTLFEIRLKVPNELKWLPWESLYDQSVGALAGVPNHCIVHDSPEEANIPPFVARSGSRIAMLVIVPPGAGLDAGLELNNIKREARKQNVDVVELGVTSPATADGVHQTLSRRTWDIVHYVGHGQVTDQGRTKILLEADSGGEYWLDAEVFASDFGQANVRLAVMNCCYSAGSGEQRDSLDGMGPLLMRSGVPAVIAMRFPIADNMAIRFSNDLYSTLFSGPLPGRIELAIQSARCALMRNQTDPYVRSFITPVLHLASGYEQIFNFEPVRNSIPTPPPPPAVCKDSVKLPQKLLDAIREQRCVPVIGPGILRLGAFRSNPPPGIFELASELAGQRGALQACLDDIEMCRRAGDRMGGQLLQWVCQLYQQDENMPKLIESIANLYRPCEPATLIRRLAGWDVPGMFYTYFDGLLERCVDQPNRKIICRLDQFDATAVSHKPFILLRGSLNDPPSLVLTESDHVRLFASIIGMRPEAAAIARQLRRSVLFFGLNPGDSLARQLSHKLLEPRGVQQRREQEKSFFLCPSRDRNAIDEAYWSEFGIEWVDGELEPTLNFVLDAAP